MRTLHDLRAGVDARRRERRRRDRLRREVGEYRTPSERQEFQEILARYDMTVDDLLAGREPPGTAAGSTRDGPDSGLWADVVLEHESSDEAETESRDQTPAPPASPSRPRGRSGGPLAGG